MDTIIIVILLVACLGLLYSLKKIKDKLTSVQEESQVYKNAVDSLSATVEKIDAENKELEESCNKLIGMNETLNSNAKELFESVEGRDKMIDTYERFIDRFSQNLTLIDQQLKQIDDRGTFKSDDEIGYVFKAVELMMSKLQEFNTNNATQEKK